MERKLTKAYSVKVKECIDISPLAYLVKSFDGSKDVIPKSQVLGYDYDVTKSDALWIAAWILKTKNIQYSKKKWGWFDRETGELLPRVWVKRHTPSKEKVKETVPKKELFRESNIF